MRSASAAWRKALMALGLSSICWAAIVLVTGGFHITMGSVVLSSRSAGPPIVFALGCELAAVAWALAAGGGACVREDWQLSASWRRRLQMWAPLAPALLVAAYVSGRLIHHWAASPPLWLDEEMIALNIRDRSLAGLAGTLWLGQSAPLGWLASERAVLLLLGAGEWAGRLLPLAFAIATLAVACWIGRRWLGAVGALVLVWLCSWNHWLAHYAIEMKQYTADAAWALWLPALAAWAIDATDARARRRRVVARYAAAAFGLWLANGALLVTPALACLLVIGVWRLDGPRAGAVAAAAGLIWVTSFAVNYELAGQYAVHNPYLREYWVHELPSPSFGVIDRIGWVVRRLPALARNPGGTDAWIALWAGAVAGFLVSDRRALAAAAASVPLAAFVISGLGIAPLYERLVVWIVPALFLGVAMLAQWSARLLTSAFRLRRWPLVLPAVVAALASVIVAWSVYDRGHSDLIGPGDSVAKQGLDDRTALQWLMPRIGPSDIVLATHMTWPAIWWYGPMSIADPGVAQGRWHDDVSLVEIVYREPGSDCSPDELAAALRGHRRAAVYLGFPDAPDAFDEFIVRRLGTLGEIREMKRFTTRSFAAVVDLTLSPSPPPPADWWIVNSRAETRVEGCLGVSTASRW